MTPFSPQRPLPKYRAFAALRDELIAYLLREKLAVGAPFFSLTALAKATGLSHVTVCRAVEELGREGWLDRRVGEGTFVGARVATPVLPNRSHAGKADGVIRVAVLSYAVMPVHGWFVHGFLSGLENAAEEEALVVEMLTVQADRLAAARQRLERSRPDVAVALIPQPDMVRLIGEAERLNIPCLVAGLRSPELRLPNVFEDGCGGVKLAVQHLHAAGHRRIGFLTQAGALPWYMADRRRGYLEGLCEHGLQPDLNLVGEIDVATDAEAQGKAVSEYLAQMRPTAVIVGAWWLTHGLAALVGRKRLRIPQDLSVVVFDQSPEPSGWLGVEATHVAQPLYEEGRTVGGLARSVCQGEAGNVAIAVPCTFVAGKSVGRRQGRSSGSTPG